MLQSRFELSSHYTAPIEGADSTYELRLLNRSGAPLSGYRLGISGSLRIAPDARLTGGILISQLSTWLEVTAEDSYVLPEGEIWSVTIEGLVFGLHHWTDGVVAAMLIHADGSREAIAVIPPTSTLSTLPRKRGTMPLPVPVPSPSGLSIIPWPRRVEVDGWRTGPAGLSPRATTPESHSAVSAFSELVEALFPGEGLVRAREEGGLAVHTEIDTAIAAESYRVQFSANTATLTAADHTGFLYGLVTLGQMARGARLFPQSFGWPTSGELEDAPAMAWRGCHLDVARRFYASGEIAQLLRVMAWNKLNRFHWHLSDDEAWRVELTSFPHLTETAAWRGYGLPVPPLLGSGVERAGGFYTRTMVQDLLALGNQLGIEVVPEIDLPGHCHALLQAMPELRDPDEVGAYHSIQGFPNNCLNPAVEAVYPLLEAILGELADIFPSKYFHVGADEVPPDAWTRSPLAQNLLRQIGGGGTPVLQAHFLRRIQRFLTGRGKIVGAWEEGAAGEGIAQEHSYLVGWHTVGASRKLAAAGYRVVVAPGQAYYLDIANGAAWHEPGAAWAGWSSPETTYAFDPIEGWSAGERSNFLGIQACIWSEAMNDRGVFDRLVFPRLSAIAETGWTAPEHKNYARFIASAGLMPNLYGFHDGAL